MPFITPYGFICYSTYQNSNLKCTVVISSLVSISLEYSFHKVWMHVGLVFFLFLFFLFFMELKGRSMTASDPLIEWHIVIMG